MSCSGAARTSSCVASGEGVADARTDTDGLGAEALGEGLTDGLAVAPGLAGVDALGLAVPALRVGAGAVEEVPRLVVVPVVGPGAEVVRRGLLVGFGAAVVGLGAAVVGLGADTVAGAVLGAVPDPKRKPTDEPGFGFQPLIPTWL